MSDVQSPWPMRLVALTIAVLVWLFASYLPRLENRSEKEVMVTLSYAVTPADRIADMSRRLSEVTVTIRGTADAIGPIGTDSIQITVPLPEDYELGVPTEVLLTPDNAVAPEGIEIRSISPSSIPVMIDELLTVAVPVTPTFQGEPGAGLTLADVRATVLPERVTVSGPRSRMTKLTNLITEPIDLGSRAIDFSEQVGLQLPDQSLTVRPDSVTVDIKLEAEPVVPTEQVRSGSADRNDP